MKKTLVLLVVVLLLGMSHAPRYPADSDALGVSAANLLGQFRIDNGPAQYRYFLGTSFAPGSLTLDWARDCKGDLAILTNSQAWGPQAGAARIEFYNGKHRVDIVDTTLQPNKTNVVNTNKTYERVVIRNTGPRVENDGATITLDNAWCK